MITYSTSGPPILKKDIAAVERRLSFKFPKDYAQFLLSINGGRPSSMFFHLRKKGHRTEVFVVNMLYGINHGDFSLEWWCRTMVIDEKRLPQGLCPIGNDPFGNLFCIAVRGKHAGAIYWQSSEHEHDADLDEEGYPVLSSLIALSTGWPQFISGLKAQMPVVRK